MPTTVVSTINKPGEDYNTIALWEAAKQGNLVTADQVQQGDCYNDDGTLDETGIVIDGSTTDSTRYVVLSSPVGERHTGKAGTGFHLRPTGNATRVIFVADQYVRVEWLELSNFFNGWYGHAHGIEFDNVGSAAAAPRATNCIVHDSQPGNTGNLHYGIAWNRFGKVWNCIVYDVQSEGIKGFDGYGGGVQVYNCTVYNCGNHGNKPNIHSADPGEIKNCCSIATNGTGNAFNYGGATGSYNIADDASATGTGSRTDGSPTDFVSTTGGSEDLRIANSDDPEVDHGTDLGTTAAIDINGRNRDTEGDVWDMGAHEFVAPASPDTFARRRPEENWLLRTHRVAEHLVGA